MKKQNISERIYTDGNAIGPCVLDADGFKILTSSDMHIILDGPTRNPVEVDPVNVRYYSTRAEAGYE